ncbi:putative E3 ubiquitin-protein ligase UBR7 [Aphelenchoides besseyi]|nr:putative E3 ubiquitin-protein ligase UBR7 [Aphelenchoides besseyi]
MSEDQKTNLNVDDVLEDGIVTNAVLMQLNEEYRDEEETERMINGPLSMVCTYPEINTARATKSYPPPDDDPMYAFEMYQCIGCEDWFHAVHLGLEDEIFDEDGIEIFCVDCVKKFPFVRPYAQNQNGAPTSSQHSTSMFENKSDNSTTDDPNQSGKSSESRRKLIIIDNREATLDSTSKCYYQEIKTSEDSSNKSLWFATCDWRMMLCRCQQCKRMYEDYECEFLLEDADTLTHYLNMNAAELEKNRREPEEEIFDEVAKRTNVDVAHSVVAEVAVLKRKLTHFMNDMAKQDKVVTKDDVQRFFVEHGAKRQRLKQMETIENEDEE